MNVSWLVAQRYIRPRRVSIISVIGAVSIVGIVIGTAALIIVMSLFNGLRGVARDLMIGFGPHIQLVAEKGGMLNDAPTALHHAQQQLQRNGITDGSYFMEPTYRSQLVVQSGNRTGVIEAVGLDNVSSPVFEGQRKATLFGSFLSDSVPNGIVLATGVAENMQVFIGDTVTLIAPRTIERSLITMSMPSGVTAVVKGIFQSNTARDVDRMYAYMSGDVLRAVTKQPKASTIDISFVNAESIPDASKALTDVPGTTVTTWEDLNRSLVATMKLEGMGSFIIIALTVVVASFSVLVTLTLGVVEKRRDIAMLLTMGMVPADIRRLYIIQGLTLGVVSVALGLIIGIAVCIGQQTFHWVAFDVAEGYLVPALPVEIQTFDVIIVAITGLVLAGTAALYPASRASKTTIAEAIRVE